ncbi:MAG: hypothetical protein Q8S53_06495 [Brevundimonas sp.]|uniref:hypothetical protein n=1 Tax=Brevundimonas sp. TaxID=1871086 RepID=UPI002733B23B|nr:hypothetical protein [Brevundimonas sp.]MDP3377997.1 hypothetical protein [Brevundimonas sp.]
MTLMTRIATAAFAAAATLGLMPIATAPAQAQTSVSISYRDYDRGYYRDVRDVRRDRHYRGYRGDARRGDWRRNDRRYRHWQSHNQYRAPRRCWTELRWDRWRGERVRVRVCR